MNKKQKKMLARILIAAAMMIALHFARRAFGDRAQEPLWFFLYLIPYLTVGWDILLKAAKGIKNKQVFDENFLMAVATVGAIAIALINRSGDYTEAIAVMLFYQVGELFQSYSRARASRARCGRATRSSAAASTRAACCVCARPGSSSNPRSRRS